MIKITSNLPADKVMVNWQVSKFCENSCHYCTAYDFKISVKKGKNVVSYTDERIALDDRIAELLPQVIKKGHILLFGGEPTLHPKGIEYFNELCRVTKDNPDVTIFLVTHGNIDDEKILSINTHGKKEHIVSISYHYYQVKFPLWLEKVKMFHERTNVIASAIVPRRRIVWKQFEENMRVLIDSGIPTELKSELDNLTNEPDHVGLARFKDMYYEAASKHSDFLNTYYLKELYLDEGQRREIVSDIEVLGGIPVLPGKSICNNRQFAISENILKFSCDEGGQVELSQETTAEDMLAFMNKNTITCMKSFCTENRQIPATIRVFGRTLDDPEYKAFLNTRL